MTFTPIETQGLVVEAPGSGFKLMSVILDDMRSDEVLVAMKYSGICHTDIVGAAGGYTTLSYPAVFGHEGAGVICAVGADVQNPALKVGESVILSFNHCGSCRNCQQSHPACCSNFEALNIDGKRLQDQSTTAKLEDGRRVASQFFGQSSFLNYSIVSQYSVSICPYPEDLRIYASLGCGFQTGAGTVLNSLKPSADDSLVVFGAGTVGIAAIMAAKYLGMRQIIAVDIVNEKLELSKELGATHTINSVNEPNLIDNIRAITGEGAKFALECTGVSSLMENMLDCVCCGGTAVIVGVPKPDFILKVDPMKLLHENKTLKGVCQGDSVAQKSIPEMIELHRAGHFPLEKLCAFYDVKDFEKALSDVRTGKVLKPVIQWE